MDTIGSDPYTGITSGTSTTGLGSAGVAYRGNGSFYSLPAATLPSSGAAYTTGDVIGMAFNADILSLAFYKNGAPQGTVTNITAGQYFTLCYCYNVSARTANFGQRPFAYTAPSGFKALCTTNLPAPTIEDGSTAMDVALYTGNGSTNTISGLNLSPDLVWIKTRSAAVSHALQDIVRGTNKVLYSNSTGTEDTYTDALTSFNSDGFTLGAQSLVNNNTSTYVAWCWDAGSSTVSNDAGSITSQVRANPSVGFSIVTYTGNGAASATIGHGLGVSPQMIMVKNRDVADDGAVYHVGTDVTSPQNYFFTLFSTSNGAEGRRDIGAMWNDTAPTSTVFSVGTEDNVNASTEDYVAYCFAPVAGYSAFGSYTGNGSTDGPFVYTGFRPRWLLFKSTAGGGSWMIHDTARNTYNVSNTVLFANISLEEYSVSPSYDIDINSNGFKIRNTGSDWNSSAVTYTYVAFAENPFALNARAR